MHTRNTTAVVIAEQRNAGTITYDSPTNPAELTTWAGRLWRAVDDGRVSCRRASELLTLRVDARVLEVASLLGRAAAADMGGTFVLQIDLGNRAGADDPGDTAGIDPERGATWWIDLGGGEAQYFSQLDVDGSPADVAAWITSQLAAARGESPAVNQP